MLLACANNADMERVLQTYHDFNVEGDIVRYAHIIDLTLSSVKMISLMA